MLKPQKENDHCRTSIRERNPIRSRNSQSSLFNFSTAEKVSRMPRWSKFVRKKQDYGEGEGRKDEQKLVQNCANRGQLGYQEKKGDMLSAG